MGQGLNRIIKEMVIDRRSAYLESLTVKLIHQADRRRNKPYRVTFAGTLAGAYATYEEAIKRYNSFRPLDGTGITDILTGWER